MLMKDHLAKGTTILCPLRKNPDGSDSECIGSRCGMWFQDPSMGKPDSDPSDDYSGCAPVTLTSAVRSIGFNHYRLAEKFG